jgi:type III pantothenate kinase
MVATALRNLLGIDAHIMTPRDVPMPVEGYDLSQIGIDRLINAFAAYDLTKSACIVVDAGSCITFDCVSDEGVYLGGAIVPGLGLSMSAMHLQTAKIPRIDYRIVGRAMGKDTESSVRAGIHFGYAGLAANLIEKLTAEMGGSPSIVVTGGDANFIAKVLSQKVLKKPSLIFEGIIKAVT